MTQPPLVLDAHQDIAWNYTDMGRDFRQSALRTRAREVGTEVAARQGGAMCGFPESLRGRVGLIFATLFVAPKAVPFYRKYAYTTPREAYEQAMRQLDYYALLADEHPQIALVRTQKELSDVLASWEEGKAIDQHKIGFVLLMEGADPIPEPRAFDEWYERGVRIVGLAWNQTRYSGGTNAPGPLTKLGEELLQVMAGYNAILDLSHASEMAFLQALGKYPGQIIASHSNPRRFCNTDRHLSDDMIRRLVERGGVIGVVPYTLFMWDRGAAPAHKSGTPMSRVVDMIDHICQIAGSARHVGFGTDFDGGFGVEHTPEGFDTVADLLELVPLFAARGYSTADIEGIFSGNFLRILRAALPT